MENITTAMDFGYSRVSTREQNEARQVEAFRERGIRESNIIIEKLSGKNLERPKLTALLDKVRPGDSVTVLSIDRLGRNTKDVLDIVERLERRGVKLVSIREGLDTNTPVGKCVLTILASIAQLERDNILERQYEGIAIAKREGRYTGRRPKELADWSAIYDEWRRGELSAGRAAKLLGISRSTFYRRTKLEESRDIIDF